MRWTTLAQSSVGEGSLPGYPKGSPHGVISRTTFEAIQVPMEESSPKGPAVPDQATALRGSEAACHKVFTKLI